MDVHHGSLTIAWHDEWVVLGIVCLQADPADCLAIGIFSHFTDGKGASDLARGDVESLRQVDWRQIARSLAVIQRKARLLPAEPEAKAGLGHLSLLVIFVLGLL